MRSIKDYLVLLFKGIAMGSADVVPGVSGGTIAFITGIYEELLRSIKSIDAEAFRLLLKLKIKEFWDHINGNFLITIVLGIGIAVFSLAKLISYLLLTYPILVWSFFFGLIIISAVLVAKDIEKKDWKAVIAGIIGIAIAFFITTATPAETTDAWWFIIISGAIAICAMILPGISGAFILLILGKYKYVIEAVETLNIGVILLFMLGCVIGILSFARVISWCLQKYQSITISVLAGFMIGSLNKVWPWKMVDSYRINSKGEQVTFLDHNILPQQYLEQVGDPQLIEAIMMSSFGILIVIIIEKVANQLQRKSI
jgi:putative membrane protein